MTDLSFLAFDAGIEATAENDLAQAFAALMARLHVEQGGAAIDAASVHEAAFQVSAATSAGHSCIAMESQLLRTRLRASPVVGCSDHADFRPLVLDADGRLYLHRYWDYERRLAMRLAALNVEAALPVADEDVAVALARHFPAREDGPDWQKIAAGTALTRRLAVISGGPGTGKTTTVARLLAALYEIAPDTRVALAAPTGKAAARMQEALHAQCERLSLDATLRARLPSTAYTVHRLLGSIAGSARFRHDADHPLPFDVVIVDEASMLDLALATKLAEALGARGRLVLLGDKDQLASVEAGAVFAELAAARGLSTDYEQRLARLTGETLAPGGDAPLQDAVVWLEHSHRFAAASAIGRLAAALRDGDTAAAQQALADGAQETTWHGLEPGADAEALADALFEGYRDYVEAVRAGDGAHRVFDAFGRYRVLCALRAGPRGAADIAAALETRMRAALRVSADATWYAGRAVIATRNDYVLQIFNGDIGIALPAPGGGLLVHFEAGQAGVKTYSPARLSGFEPAFALTVHKAQGSEFDRIDLVLPQSDSRVLGAELIYTAITRARGSVGVWGDEAVFNSGIARRAVRASGLARQLRSLHTR